MAAVDRDGFVLVPRVLAEPELVRLRAEADRVAAAAGTACVRHVRARSGVLDGLVRHPMLTAGLPPGWVCVRSILFDKTPQENWPVAWHQDTTLAVAGRAEIPGYGPWSIKDGVVHVQPPVPVLERMVTLRLHLDDTPSTQGALRVLAGSHRCGRLDGPAIREWRLREARVCACGPGDVLWMRPLLLHASSRAADPERRRRVLHFEFAPPDALDSRLRWAEA